MYRHNYTYCDSVEIIIIFLDFYQLPEPVNQGVNPSHSVGWPRGTSAIANKQNAINPIIMHYRIRLHVVDLKRVYRRRLSAEKYRYSFFLKTKINIEISLFVAHYENNQSPKNETKPARYDINTTDENRQ